MKMRSAPKFSLIKRGRKKGGQLLLSDSQDRDTSDFLKIEDGHDESRNDEVDVGSGDPWLKMPYKIPIEASQHDFMNSSQKETGIHATADTTSNYDAIISTRNTSISRNYEDENAEQSTKTKIKNERFISKKQTASTSQKESEEVHLRLQNEPSGGDVFDNILPHDSLEDILAERNIAKAASKLGFNEISGRSFKIDADSSDSSDQLKDQSKWHDSIESSCTTSDAPGDPRFSKKKGMLIVDPLKNGEVYRMDEQNKCLTNKELIIIGGMRGVENNTYDDDDDDETLMSSLTEVTYQRSKEERIKYIMKNLKDAASQIPESRAWCSVFECPAINNDSNKITPHVVEGKGELSMTQNARILFNSITNKEGEKVDLGSFTEKIVVCITRIYLSLQEAGEDNGLRCSYNEPNLCHDLGVRLKEAKDGQAVVVEVLSETTAERSGVRVGDILSFAVPLNNTFQGYEKACDFISRLELIGMRTSYRAIFDIFLSKTFSGWPVATVFKRQSRAMKNFEMLPFRVLSVDINIDLSAAVSLFHEVVTRSREYDYNRESNGVHEAIRGNIASFIPLPECRASRKHRKTNGTEIKDRAKVFGLDTGSNARSIFVPKISDENLHQSIFCSHIRRSSLLTWYTENSDSVLYLNFNGTFGGSGVGVFRAKGGESWSPPCAIRANILGVGFRPNSANIECMIFVRDICDLDGLRKGYEITVGGKDQNDRVLVITKIADRFCIEADFKCSCIPRNEINTQLYSKYHSKPTTENIFNGTLPTPSEAASFGGALRRLEMPSTMYPHPTPPNNLVKFNDNDWTCYNSCKASGTLEAPFDETSIGTLKDLLQSLENGESIYTDELNEFEVFTQKFHQMLYDGVTIDRAWAANDKEEGSSNNSRISKVTLKLDSTISHSGRKQTLLFVDRSNANMTGDRIHTCDFSKPTKSSKSKFVADSLRLLNIVEISQNMPKSFIKPHTSNQEIKKQRRRFVSLTTKDGKKALFLARTGKDASLLACGLKLIAERCQDKKQFQ